MNSRDFVYWLQGFFELNEDGNDPLSPRQVEVIKNHLNLVFKHEIYRNPEIKITPEDLAKIRPGPKLPLIDSLESPNPRQFDYPVC